jgi:hypothetical protein
VAPLSLSCLDDVKVLAYVEGRLGEEAMAAAREHVDACRACMALLVEVIEALARTPAR